MYKTVALTIATAVAALLSLAGPASATDHAAASGYSHALGCSSPVKRHDAGAGARYWTCKPTRGAHHRNKYVAVFNVDMSWWMLALSGGKCHGSQVRNYMLLTSTGNVIAVNAADGNVPRRYARWTKRRVHGSVFHVCLNK